MFASGRFEFVLGVVLILGCEPRVAFSRSGTGDAGADSLTLEEVRGLVDSVGASELFTRVSVPSPDYTDLFGIQLLQPYTLDQVVADLVPRHARIVHRDARALTLDFVDGPRVIFPGSAALVFNGNRFDVPRAKILISDPHAYPEQAVAFRARLRAAGVASRYLVPNPWFELEKEAARLRADSTSIEPIAPRADTTGFGKLDRAVLLVGETHGGTEVYDRVAALLQSAQMQWLALEMASVDLQPAIDTYLATEDGDPGHEQAKQTLLAYYAANWNTRGHEITAAPADNPYFRLIDLAKTLGKAVYALDTEPFYTMFRFGEFPLGATTRDAVWAAHVPLFGRGILYGGSAHFSPIRRPNMLTFLKQRDPELPVFVLTPQ